MLLTNNRAFLSVAAFLTFVAESSQLQGLPGPPGDTGSTGPSVIGGTGPVGGTGATGPLGPPGDAGPDYPFGPVGNTGNTGSTGSSGAIGPVGRIGSTGLTGSSGRDGFALIGNPIVCMGGLVARCWKCNATSFDECAVSGSWTTCGSPEEICYTNTTVLINVNKTVVSVQRGCRPITNCTGAMMTSQNGSCLFYCGGIACPAQQCTTCNVTVTDCVQPSGSTGTTLRTTPEPCIPGPFGATGDTGQPGLSIGFTGPTGSTGTIGFIGATGATGGGGPRGATGLNGVKGVVGPNGPLGHYGATGPPGPPGVDVIVQGFNWPAGVNRVKRQAGGCPLGPKGPTGATGQTPALGLMGATGSTGATGLPGRKGVPGVSGSNGSAPLRGPDGGQGSTGDTGIAGPTGANGLPGPPGSHGRYIAWLRAPVVTSLSPQYGPLAGGTRLTMYGNELVYNATATYVPAKRRRRKRQQVLWVPQVATISEVLIGKERATVDTNSSVLNKLIVTTPTLTQTGSYTIFFILSKTLIYNTSFTFSYRSDPTISTVEPLDHLTVGGTIVNVTGTNLTSVAAPKISLTIVVTRFVSNFYFVSPDGSITYEDCYVVNARNMQCLMPPVNLESDFVTQLESSSDGNIINANGSGVATVIGPNGKDRSDIYFGIVLDGLMTYSNISETQPTLKMRFYTPPTLSCSLDSITTYNPGGDQPVKIKGSQLTRGNRQQDVHIHVGDGNCIVTQLTDNEITCQPPRDKPGKGNDSKCDADTLPVEVFIGFATYDCNCLRYSSGSVNIPLIVGLTVGLGGGLLLALIIVIVVILVYRRRQRRQKQANANPARRNDPKMPSGGDDYNRSIVGSNYSGKLPESNEPSSSHYSKSFPMTEMENDNDGYVA